MTGGECPHAGRGHLDRASAGISPSLLELVPYDLFGITCRQYKGIFSSSLSHPVRVMGSRDEGVGNLSWKMG